MSPPDLDLPEITPQGTFVEGSFVQLRRLWGPRNPQMGPNKWRGVRSKVAFADRSIDEQRKYADRMELRNAIDALRNELLLILSHGSPSRTDRELIDGYIELYDIDLQFL